MLNRSRTISEEIWLRSKFDKCVSNFFMPTEVSNWFDKEDSIEYISNQIGEKIRRLPVVMVDDEVVGSYYDLFEYLINKKVINYEGKLCQKNL